jgi:hypothetical protein
MMVARWSIDAKFGYKQSVLDSMKRWAARHRATGRDQGRQDAPAHGSVGALEATIQTEHLIENLGELNQILGQAWRPYRLTSSEQELEPHVGLGHQPLGDIPRPLRGCARSAAAGIISKDRPPRPA